MKTKFTTTIDKDLLKEVRIKAIKEEININEIIEEGFRNFLGQVIKYKYVLIVYDYEEIFFQEVFDTADEANEMGQLKWDNIHKNDKMSKSVSVYKIKEEDMPLSFDDPEQLWDINVEDDSLFNSKR